MSESMAEETLKRIRQAVTKHGRYSQAAKAERLYVRMQLSQCRTTVRSVEDASYGTSLCSFP